MLERVALNQTGFKLPGVAPDARGVLLGKHGGVLLATLDRVVSFFRLLSEESSLDDVLPALKIYQVRSLLHSQEFLVVLHATSSYLLDRCARVASLCGGLALTGTGRHLIKYRDRHSPLGYDTDELYSDPCDFVVYGDAFVQAYSRVREVPFLQLVTQLQPRPVPGGLLAELRSVDDREREVLWLTVRRGLAAKVLGFLWRSRVRGAAAVITDDQPPPPGAAAGEARRGGLFAPHPDYLLLRVQALPERTLRLFAQLPGVELYRPVGENFVVELGYRHPVRLESCTSIFDKERFYLFAGRRQVCEALSRPPLVPLESLIEAPLTLITAEARPRGADVRAPIEGPQVRLRLGRTTATPGRVTATLVPWSRIRWFKRLVYALPPPLLSGYRAAPIDEGLFVVCPAGVEGLPIGDLFQEAAPSVFIPLGTRLEPPVSADMLTDHVGGVLGKYVLLLPGAGEATQELRALALPHGLFEALGRRALAPITVAPRDRHPGAPKARAQGEFTITNDALGAARPLFSLWGFRPAAGKPEPPGDA